MRDEEARSRRALQAALKRLAMPVAAELDAALGGELDETLRRVNDAMGDVVLGEGMPSGFSPESYLAPGVPRIRPFLVVLASRAAGGGDLRTDEAAFSAELLHLAVAVHDTALGRQGGRRRRIARRLLGGAAHWLGGNHLTLRALEIARHAPAPEILNEVLDTLREISEVHALAQDLRDRDPQASDYRHYADGHTGSVFAFCTRAGARLAGADAGVITSLGLYGRHMGVAWHALEDHWSFSVPSEHLPRLLAHSVAHGRPLLPLIHAMERDPEVDGLIDRVLGEGELAAAATLCERVRASGALFETRRVVIEETLAARRALRRLEPSPEREALDRLARSLAASGAKAASEEPP
ncbi:MAG: polyprenyl synthetase family protein [Alphaproteobacteria bacterium]|nr:polyprenyl synthetase family protein [Alphaproteobacteria bacterium]